MESLSVKIVDITEETFNVLVYKWLPSLPFVHSSTLIRNSKELMDWKELFIKTYGSDGELRLYFNTGKPQVINNQNFNEAWSNHCKTVENFYKKNNGKILYD